VYQGWRWRFRVGRRFVEGDGLRRRRLWRAWKSCGALRLALREAYLVVFAFAVEAVVHWKGMVGSVAKRGCVRRAERPL
jgi:hypothetical protein